MDEPLDLLIIGGGIAGLACAIACSRRGMSWSLVESSSRVGGRVATDELDGYLLDRGFQVYLSAYPETRGTLDLAALDMRAFAPGASVFHAGRWRRIAHPLKRPGAALGSLLSGAVTVADAMRLLPVARRAARGPVRPPDASARGEPVPGESADPLVRQATGKVPLIATAADALREWGVSDALVESFFRPFFGGVFLDRSLAADRRAFEFRLAMFARGSTMVPALGMGQIPIQMAGRLDASRIRTGWAATGLSKVDGLWQVQGPEGHSVRARTVAVAADGEAARALVPELPSRSWCETATLHYTFPAAGAPAQCLSPWLMLDGDGDGPVNHAAAMSAVSPRYAPVGRVLLGASVVDQAALAQGDGALDSAVRSQMSRWFPSHAPRTWTLLRVDRIRHALPRQHPGDLAQRGGVDRGGGLLVCGDHIGDGSINGAMQSGRLAAELALAQCGARMGAVTATA
jgi:phytoene dehydrogenase-like protein